jgi:copper homeostasis protein
MMLTFHRAFDVCQDYQTNLSHIIEAKCDRLLTSGALPQLIIFIVAHEENLKTDFYHCSGCSSSASSETGKNILADIVELASNRIAIIAAAGVNSKNVKDIISTTKGHTIPSLTVWLN